MQRRPAILSAVVGRELGAFFSNPASYVFIAGFALACSAALFRDTFFINNEASLGTLNEWFPYLMLGLVPAIAMGTWAGERAQGTDEILLTLPASDTAIVWGKYLASILVFLLCLVFTLPQVAVLMVLGEPDLGLLAANYAAFALLGAAMLGLALIGSLLATNQTVAFILGVVLVGALVGFESLVNLVYPAASPNWPIARFEEMGRGILALPSLWLFLGLVLVFGMVQRVLLSRRLWKGSTGWHLSAQALCALVIVGAGTVAWSAFAPRLDTTADKIHSLSDTTAEVLADLDSEEPVVIEAFISPSVPGSYAQTRRDLLNLLRQYDALAGGGLSVRIVETELFTEEAERAREIFDIEAQAVGFSDGDAQGIDRIFLGLVFSRGAEQATLPFLYENLPVEYELTRGIRSVARATKRRVGILRTDAKWFGGFDFQTRRFTQDAEIIGELRKQYVVIGVDADTEYPNGEEALDALVVPMLSSLAQPQMDRLASWIDAGGKAFLIDDPFPVTDTTLSPDAPKGGASSPFQQQAPPTPKGDVAGFLLRYGVDWNPGVIAVDSYLPYPKLAERISPEVVFAGAKSGAPEPFHPEDPISSGLQEFVTIFGGVVRPTPGVASMRYTPLITTSDAAALAFKRDTFETAGPFGGGGRMPMEPQRRRAMRYRAGFGSGEAAGRRDAPFHLAARVQGTPKGGESEVDLVFLPDFDALGPFFFEMRRNGGGPIEFQLDNVTFALNAIDVLAGDTQFVELRKRRPSVRSLERIEAADKSFAQARDTVAKDAEKAADEASSKAQGRFDERIEAISADQGLDAQSREIRIASVRGVEERKLEVSQAAIELERDRAIEKANASRKRSQAAERDRWRLIGTVVPTLLAVVVGLVTFFVRLQRERSQAPSTRRLGSPS